MIAGILYSIIGLLEALIVLRILLRVIGADPGNTFVSWIYSWSTPFVAPFAGIFGQEATVSGVGAVTQSVFDWSALVALVVYGIVGAVIGQFAIGRRRASGV